MATISALVLLDKHQIMKVLNIKGQGAWVARKPDLMASGMFRVGKGWNMRPEALEAYILRQENKAIKFQEKRKAI